MSEPHQHMCAASLPVRPDSEAQMTVASALLSRCIGRQAPFMTYSFATVRMNPELFAVCFAGVDVLGWSLLLWHVLLCFVLHRK